MSERVSAFLLPHAPLSFGLLNLVWNGYCFIAFKTVYLLPQIVRLFNKFLPSVYCSILNPIVMRKRIIPVALFASLLIFSSCSRGITTYEAANGKAKCGRHLR